MTGHVIHGADFAHILQDDEEGAIKAAMAANRPLLVRGEPGVGKTQLAKAAAVFLNRPLVSMTVDANTEPREIMWTFDAVQRLAEAQVAAVTCKSQIELRPLIDVKQFVKPGPLWWAYSWDSAKDQLREHEEPPASPAGWASKNGVVILIDEIDKAESEVPNGLLESLGSHKFMPQGWRNAVTLATDVAAPLIIITTNEERMLPDAFVRRCFVLHLELPPISAHDPKTPDEQTADQAFTTFLQVRGKAHFQTADDGLLAEAATMLLADRRYAMQHRLLPLPGQAEYLDFVRAVQSMSIESGERQKVLQQVRTYAFRKSRRPQR